MKATVTIAGGGLAGLSLAAGLRLRGIPVEVHEAGSYPRHRVCGEFISGVDTSTLDALGIREALRDARLLESVAWFSKGRKIHEDTLSVPAYGISRHRLDCRLRDAVVGGGAAVLESSRVSRAPREGLVWAAGRIPSKGRWIGLKCHFADLPLLADLEMHLGSDGYAGLASVEDGRVNVCGLFRVDRSHRGSGPELLLDYLRAGGNEALASRLALALPDPASFSATAGFALGRQRADDGLCAIGDAESMIPPFTGNGMSMAFQSAEAALDPLAGWSEGHLDWNDCIASIRTALHGKFRRRLTAAAFMHPVLLRSGGRRLIEALGVSGLLPFRPLLSLVR
ncbi:NAD(P)/FAD-dependent oxidoreductase [Luteolibacter sp. Populi]|uniref:NAD(P)/FAD-dependent oxidoreductase n=1 Tax=Luteolibacter sp. Populi TaxID=3230487 RepID=UPI003466DFBE